MPKQLFFQNLKQEAPVEARIIPGQGVAHLVIHGEDHKPWHSYSAPTAEMAALLQDLLHQTRAILAGHNPLSESDDWHAEAEPAPEVQRWERRSKFTTDHVSKSVPRSERFARFIEHFRHSPAGEEVSFLVEWALEEYKAETGRAYQSDPDTLDFADLPALEAPAAVSPSPSFSPRPPGEGSGVRARGEGQSQLHRDLETIRPRLAEVIQNGQFVRGHQTRIAEILGITNAGVTNRQRILKVARALERLLNSSTTSSTAAEPPAAADSKAIRAA